VPKLEEQMKMGLERGLREKIPEIVDVVQVSTQTD
jgi:Fe-S cluster biogenesis protein NfuA